MRVNQSPKYYHQEFDSVADLLAFTEPSKLPDEEWGTLFKSNASMYEEWSNPEIALGGLERYSDARDLAGNGWHDGATRIKAVADSIRDKVETPVAIRRRMVWGSQGDEIEIAKVYSGELDTAWREAKRVNSAGNPVITLYVPWGNLSGVSAEQMFWNSAPALVIADVLEDAGYRVELIAASYTRHGWNPKNFLLQTVIVKASDAPMDLPNLASICCHAGVYRTIAFAARLSYPKNDYMGATQPITGLFDDGIALNRRDDQAGALAECNRILAQIGQQIHAN